jgi:acetolactate synthase I/II/III large subunit
MTRPAEEGGIGTAGGGGRTGGRILVDQLLACGADLAFCVPGESYLPVLDALADEAKRIPLISCRHEAAAVVMAEAYGKLTGRPGLCLVTRAPGAMHAAIGLHTAFHDATPMILLIGQVPRAHLEREAFQELDYRRVFAPTAKWVAQVEDTARIPEFVARAYATATGGRPGPVVLSLPQDVLWEEAAVSDTQRVDVSPPHPGPPDLARIRTLLAAAARPLLLVGGGGWSGSARRDIEAFAVANDLPVVTAFRCQDYVDNHLDQYVGTLGIAADPALARRVRDADLIIVVGERLTDTVTDGYTLLEAPRPRPALVHVLPDPSDLGRVYHPTLAITAGAAPFAAAARELEPVERPAWRRWRAAARDDYLAYSTPGPGVASGQRGDGVGSGVDLAAVLGFLQERLPGDAVVTNGAGNYTTWVHRFTRYRRYRTQLAPASGAMGYGVPAAIAAKAVHPARMVVAFAGDGCFLMTGQELATAAQYDLPVVVVVVNNNSYGTIRMHQERFFAGRTHGTVLRNPDFAAFARAFGGHGETVTATGAFPEAFERAVASGLPAVIELRVDPEQTLPHLTLRDVRRGRSR